MPLTQLIIKKIVKDQIVEELKPVWQELRSINRKIDRLTDIVLDFAGQVRKFDEEQTLLSDHVSGLTDRVEKLEGKVFGPST